MLSTAPTGEIFMMLCPLPAERGQVNGLDKAETKASKAGKTENEK